jgi:hypothetical protein
MRQIVIRGNSYCQINVYDRVIFRHSLYKRISPIFSLKITGLNKFPNPLTSSFSEWSKKYDDGRKVISGRETPP